MTFQNWKSDEESFLTDDGTEIADPFDFLDSIKGVNSLLADEISRELEDIKGGLETFPTEVHFLLDSRGMDKRPDPSVEKEGVFLWQLKLVTDLYQCHCQKCSNPRWFNPKEDLWHRESFEEVWENVQFLEKHPKLPVAWCPSCERIKPEIQEERFYNQSYRIITIIEGVIDVVKTS